MKEVVFATAKPLLNYNTISKGSFMESAAKQAHNYF